MNEFRTIENSEIIRVHTTNGYQKRKKFINEDLRGQIAILDSIDNLLGQKNKLVFRYVESSSPKTLLKVMSFQVHLNHALTSLHQKGNLIMNTSPYQRIENQRIKPTIH